MKGRWLAVIRRFFKTRRGGVACVSIEIRNFRRFRVSLVHEAVGKVADSKKENLEGRTKGSDGKQRRLAVAADNVFTVERRRLTEDCFYSSRQRALSVPVNVFLLFESRFCVSRRVVKTRGLLWPGTAFGLASSSLAVIASRRRDASFLIRWWWCWLPLCVTHGPFSSAYACLWSAPAHT